MPIIYEPQRKHDCLVDNRHDPGLNRSDIPLGTIWQCPTCDQHFLRKSWSYGTSGYWAKISQRNAERFIKRYKKEHR